MCGCAACLPVDDIEVSWLILQIGVASYLGEGDVEWGILLLKGAGEALCGLVCEVFGGKPEDDQGGEGVDEVLDGVEHHQGFT